MTISLYQCADDSRKMNKTLTAERSYNVQLKNDTDVTAPVFLLSSPLPPNYNYGYIPDFKRYYFIESSSITVGKMYEISLKCDVLMTYKSEISQSAVIVRRSSNKGNKLIPDNIPLLAKRQYIYKNFKGTSDGFGSDKVQTDTTNILAITM